MEKSFDINGRILHYKSEKAQEYLRKVKGEKYIQYRKDWESYGENQMLPNRPLQLNVELSEYCNLHCKMCYRSHMEEIRHGCLELEDIESLARQVKDLDIPSLLLAGTEPFMHPQMKQVLKIFSAADPLDFWIITNGLLLTEDMIEAVIDSGVTWLSISIDAASEETYRTIRGGDYKKLIGNIDNFLSLRKAKKATLPFLRVSFLQMPENMHEVEQFVSIWDKKADIIDFQTLSKYDDLESIPEELVQQQKAQFQCTDPFRLISILTDGSMVPCCNGFYNIKSEYNIKKNTLEEYWNSPWRKKFSKTVKDKNYCKTCRDCMKSFISRE